MTTSADLSPAAQHALALIRTDRESGALPQTIGSFSVLHDYVDANDYLAEALPSRRCESHNGWVTRANALMAEIEPHLTATTTL